MMSDNELISGLLDESLAEPAPAEGPKAAPRDLPALMRKIPVTLTLEVGEARLSLHDLAQLQADSVVELDTLAGAPLIIVNGPIVQRLRINCGTGVFGPGWRANATIGRALRLVQLNIAGSIPGRTTMSTQASPGRFTMCFGEHEERSPWEPFHVQHGFKPTDSTVSVFTGFQSTAFTLGLRERYWHAHVRNMLRGSTHRPSGKSIRGEGDGMTK